MRRSYLRFFIIIFFILIITPLKSEEKVTFLNLDAVLNNSKIGMNIVKKLNDLKNLNLKQINDKKEIIKKKEKDLINKKNILSKEEFETSLIALQKEVGNFNNEKNKKEIDYETIKKKELDNFTKKITPLIEDYIIENSISLVVNQNNIFIGKKKYDITNDIINLIDNNLK
tara:strand:- start:1040 stop:1552 length:513 start_codon:yes stop_codon:yes gene_type:complete